MICRTLRPRSAWSFAINMYWDTDQATTSTTLAGAKSKSNCARPRAFRLSPCTPRPDTTRLRTERLPSISFARLLPVLPLLLLFSAATALAQVVPVAPTPPPPPPGQSGQNVPENKQGRIALNVNLVVLHTAVLDDRGKFVDG